MLACKNNINRLAQAKEQEPQSIKRIKVCIISSKVYLPQ